MKFYCRLYVLFQLSRYLSMKNTMTMAASSRKTISIIRHGTTEMNEHLRKFPWGSPNFVDAALWDTRLTSQGIKQAKTLNIRITQNYDGYDHLLDADLLVSSPLTRAIQTSQYAFGNTHFFPSSNVDSNYNENQYSTNSNNNLFKNLFASNGNKASYSSLSGSGATTRSTTISSSVIDTATSSRSNNPKKKILLPLAAERLYLSSDVGRPVSVLQQEYPHWDYTHITPPEQWWYTNKHYPTTTTTTTTSTKYMDKIYPLGIHHDSVDVTVYKEWRPNGTYTVLGEPTKKFRQRMINLRHWLLQREESKIILVCHWGVAKALTGIDFENCEVKTMDINDLLVTPCIRDDD